MLGDPLGVAGLEVLSQPAKRLEVHRDRDARQSGVAREDVRELVVELRELRGVGLGAVRPEEAGDVAVVQRSIRRRLVLQRWRHLLRDERVAPVSADDDLGVRAAPVGEPHSYHAVAVPEKVTDGRPLHEVDALRHACALQEDEVERLSADREAVADRARILRRSLSGLGRAVGVIELPRERRAAEVEDGLENAEPVEHADHPGSAKEVRRRCRARKSCTVDKQHGDPCVTEQRRQHRAAHSSPNHDHVVAVAHPQSSLES